MRIFHKMFLFESCESMQHSFKLSYGFQNTVLIILNKILKILIVSTLFLCLFKSQLSLLYTVCIISKSSFVMLHLIKSFEYFTFVQNNSNFFKSAFSFRLFQLSGFRHCNSEIKKMTVSEFAKKSLLKWSEC